LTARCFDGKAFADANPPTDGGNLFAFAASNPSAVTVTLVLKKAGTIDYYCRFHPNMKATLTVGP